MARRLVLAASFLVLLVGGLAFGAYRHAQPTSAGVGFVPRPLLGAAPDEVGQYALEYTRERYPVLSGTAQVRLVRPVAAADLPTLGLPGIGAADEGTPLMLVIVQGDFDLRKSARTRLDPALWHWRVAYIAYVFDLRAGMPTLMQSSPQGGLLRRPLNDPSLPEDLPKVAPRVGVPHQEANPMPTVPPGYKGQPYGVVAPTVAPPTTR